MDIEDTLDDTPEVQAPVSNPTLFSGDTGALAEDTRRALVKLLLGPTLDGQRHSKLWPVMLRDEAVLRSRLHDLFLELIIDRDQEVAFVRQVESEDLEIPVLLRTAKLTFLESALLLFLRERLLAAESEGERAVVSDVEMLEQLRLYGKRDSTDFVGLEKKREAAIKKLKNHSVLRKLRSEGRYEVSPVLKLLFSAEQVKELTRMFKDIAKEEREAELAGLSEPERAARDLASDRASLEAALAAEDEYNDENVEDDPDEDEGE